MAHSNSEYDRIHQEGQRAGEREELAPCTAVLISDCGMEPYEARVFLHGFETAKRHLGVPIEMSCDHASFVACLAAARPLRHQ